MKVVFLADAHIKGLEDPNQAALVEFLDGMEADFLVVLGDLFDFWTGFNEVLYYRYMPALDALLRLKGRGTRVVYVEGNHDFTMGSFFTEVIGADVYPEFCELKVDGRTFLLGHGDTIGAKLGYSLWRGFLRSGLFRILTRVFTPAFVIGVADRLSRRSRNNGGTRGAEVERRLKEFADEKLRAGADTVVLAHSHVQGVHREDYGTYANPGAWTDGGFLVYEDGRVKAERFSPEGAKEISEAGT